MPPAVDPRRPLLVPSAKGPPGHVPAEGGPVEEQGLESASHGVPHHAPASLQLVPQRERRQRPLNASLQPLASCPVAREYGPQGDDAGVLIVGDEVQVRVPGRHVEEDRAAADEHIHEFPRISEQWIK